MGERRGILIHPQELEDSWIERLEDAGLNVLGLHPAGGREAHKTLEEAIHRHLLPDTRRIIKRLNRRGIAVEYEAHAMGYLLPRGLFSAAPGWFRVDEAGNRAADFNLCPSSDEALDFIARRAEQLARMLETGSDRYYFWLDDVTGYKCFCEKCRALSASDQQMLVVNALLRGLRRYNRAAKTCFLAYHDCLEAPVKVGPMEGVFLEYAPIERDSGKPLFDESCPQNAEQVRSLSSLFAVFGRGDSQVLEYWVDNSRFSDWKKPPKKLVLAEAVLAADVKAYRAAGFESITSFGCFLGEDYRALWGEPPVKRYGEILAGAAEK